MRNATPTIVGMSQRKKNYALFDGDECIAPCSKQHVVRFRLYPIASYTGVCANGNYERFLGLHIYKHFKGYYSRSNYTIGRVNELHEKCRDGYICKILEVPVYVRTANRRKDKIVWICNYS